MTVELKQVTTSQSCEILRISTVHSLCTLILHEATYVNIHGVIFL